MIKDNRNNEQIYGRNDMVMLNPNNKIYGSLGIADKYVMKTEEGASLILSNPKPGKFDDVLTEFNIYGRSSQITTTGKNLLKYPYVEANKTTFGVTFMDNKDGSINISGTSTGTSYYNLYSNIDGKRLTLASGTYKLVVKGRSKCNVSVNNGVDSAKNEGTFTITDGHNDVWCYIEVPKGLALDETICPMIQLASITDESYEPYTGGIPSPSPDYPQEIKSVVNPTIKVCGKNLLKPNFFIYDSNGITCDIVENKFRFHGTFRDSYSYWHVNNNLLIKKGTKVQLYVDNYNNHGVFAWFKKPGSYDVVQTLNKSGTSITINDDCYLTEIGIEYYAIGDTIDFTTTIAVLSGTNHYEPYKEQSIQLPITLNAIPVQSGGNVTIDGQQYISDYVDVARGKLVRMVGVTDQDTFVASKWSGTGSIVICSKMSNVDSKNAIATISSKYISEWVASDEIHHFTQKKGQTLVIVLPKTITTVEQGEEIRAKGFKFYYILVTPIEIDLTTEEIAAFKALVAYYPVTIIGNNYNTWMKATYKSIESV